MLGSAIGVLQFFKTNILLCLVTRLQSLDKTSDRNSQEILGTFISEGTWLSSVFRGEGVVKEFRYHKESHPGRSPLDTPNLSLLLPIKRLNGFLLPGCRTSFSAPTISRLDYLLPKEGK